MTFDFPAYSLAYLLNTGLTMALGVIALHRRRAPGAAAFASIMLFAAIWSFTQFVESGMLTIAGKLFWTQLLYIGVVTVAPLWFLFAVRYTHSPLLNGKRVWLLAIIPTITLILAWIHPLTDLIWTDITLVPGNPHIAIFSHGAWLWVHAGFSYILVIAGSVLLVRESIYAPRIHQLQSLALVVGALAPVIANLIYLADLFPMSGFDLTPFGFTLTGLIYLPMIFGLRMLDLTPVARGAVIDHMGDAVLVLDHSGRIVDMNPASGQILGVNINQCMGKPMSAALAIHPELAALSSDDVPLQSVVLLAVDPPIYIDVRKTALNDGKARPVGTLLLLRDVTQSKLAEQRAFDLALEQERVRVLSRFIRDASHEFRTPLTVINTSLYLMNRQSEPTLQHVQHDKIAAQVERLNTLIDDMLTMSKLDEGESFSLVDISINGLLANIIEAACGKQSKRVAVSLDLAENLPLIRGDAAQLHRAFTNLFCNALQYTPEEGHVDMRTRERDGIVVITLSDTGPGIDQANQARVFERFFRTDGMHSTSGIGLGLPIARAIIEAHAGVIELQSQPGQGSIFTIQFPALHPRSSNSLPVQRRLTNPLLLPGAPAIEAP